MAFSTVDGITAVEFDGDEHYRNTLKIKNDQEKDKLALALGMRVVRIPYWVQLTDETLFHYFGLHAEIIQDFPHGFIVTKIFPASYCELGIKRFEREIQSLPDPVKIAVVQSLKDRIEEHGIEYVLPRKLRHYAAPAVLG
jgi:hypothetical protein